MRILQKTFLCLTGILICTGKPLEYEVNHGSHAPKDYSFSYGVKDVHTGDIKEQWEKKNGENVRGHYQLVEADGSVRVVDYTADDKSGFKATVKHKGVAYHPISKKPEPHFPTSHSELTIEESEISHEIPTKEEPIEVHEDPHSEFSETYEPQEEVKENKQQYVYVTRDDEYDNVREQQEVLKPESSYNYPNNKPIYSKPYPTKLPESKFQKLEALPIDLTYIKPALKEKKIPIEISLLKPVEIDLTSNKGIHNYQYSQEEHDFSKNTFVEPEIETGFQPINVKKYSTQISSNTFQSNKKPKTTPGLKNFATSKLPKYKSPMIQKPIYRPPGNAGPVQFPRIDERNQQNHQKKSGNAGRKHEKIVKYIFKEN